MPIYEYECKHCQHHFEVMQKISDNKLEECPSCHQKTLQRLVSAAGFQLKGSGWYVTDFRDKGQSNSEKKTEASTTSKTDENK